MAIGNFGIGGFRIPGAGGIDIEELVAQYKRAPTQSKKTKPKPKPKAKAKAKPKPKPKIPIRPNMRGGRFGLMEDSGLAPAPKKKAVAVKPKPKPKPRSRPTPSRASIARGMEDFARAPVTTSRPKTKPKPKPKPAIVSRPKVTPRPSPVKIAARPKISSEDLMKVGPQEKGRASIPKINLSSVIPGANINIQEIIKQVTQTPTAQAPSETKEVIKEKENIVSKIANQPTSEDKSFVELAIDETKKKSESISDEEMLSILQKLFKTEQPQQQPQMPQMPQLPQVQQWDMMGQQQTGSMMPTPMSAVVKGPFMPLPMPPQMPSEMFGGYGGTAPIVPAMAYAGLGNFPQPPQMAAPRYDPDAEPGGPPMPTGPVFT